MSRLDKLALIELLPAFTYSLFAFIVLVILAGVMKPVIEIMTKYGVGGDVVLKYFFLALPQWIVFTFPMAVLTGTMMAVSALSSHFEIVAVRGVGISLVRFTLPFVGFALLIVGFTFLLNEKVAPYTNRMLQDLERDIVLGKTGKIEEDLVNLRLMQGGKLRYFLVADKLRGNSLTRVNLFSFNPEKESENFYLRSENATWTGDRWQFFNGIVYNFQPDGTVITTKFASTVAEEFAMTPREISKLSRDPSELTISELKDVIRHFKEEERLTSSQLLRFQVDYFFKYSIPLSPIFFVLIAVPLAIVPVRTTTAVGMGYSILILLLYIFLIIICTQAGRGGLIPPALAAWIPNISVLLIGVCLIWLKNK